MRLTMALHSCPKPLMRWISATFASGYRTKCISSCLSYQILRLQITNFGLLQRFQYARYSGLQGGTDGI